MKITTREYIAAKKVVETYEDKSNFSIKWECKKNLYMEETKERAFTKGFVYEQKYPSRVGAIDDRGSFHTFGNWEKHFVIYDEGTRKLTHIEVGDKGVRIVKRKTVEDGR